MSENTLSRRDFLRLSGATALTTMTACAGYPPVAESNPDPGTDAATSSAGARGAGGYGVPEKPVTLPKTPCNA